MTLYDKDVTTAPDVHLLKESHSNVQTVIQAWKQPCMVKLKWFSLHSCHESASYLDISHFYKISKRFYSKNALFYLEERGRNWRKNRFIG